MVSREKPDAEDPEEEAKKGIKECQTYHKNREL